MRGTLYKLDDYYEKFQVFDVDTQIKRPNRREGEGEQGFIRRKIKEGVFKLKERTMHYHFKKGTGYVFVSGKNHIFLMEGIVR